MSTTLVTFSKSVMVCDLNGCSRGVGLALAVLCSASLPSCTCAHQGQLQPDGAVFDAGAPDGASPDAGEDGGADAGADAGGDGGVLTLCPGVSPYEACRLEAPRRWPPGGVEPLTGNAGRYQALAVTDALYALRGDGSLIAIFEDGRVDELVSWAAIVSFVGLDPRNSPGVMALSGSGDELVFALDAFKGGHILRYSLAGNTGLEVLLSGDAIVAYTGADMPGVRGIVAGETLLLLDGGNGASGDLLAMDRAGNLSTQVFGDAYPATVGVVPTMALARAGRGPAWVYDALWSVPLVQNYGQAAPVESISSAQILLVTGETEFSFSALAVAPDQAVYGYDDRSGSILRMDHITGEIDVCIDEAALESAAGRPVWPRVSLATDAAGNIYILGESGDLLRADYRAAADRPCNCISGLVGGQSVALTQSAWGAGAFIQTLCVTDHVLFDPCHIEDLSVDRTTLILELGVSGDEIVSFQGTLYRIEGGLRDEFELTDGQQLGRLSFPSWNAMTGDLVAQFDIGGLEGCFDAPPSSGFYQCYRDDECEPGEICASPYRLLPGAACTTACASGVPQGCSPLDQCSPEGVCFRYCERPDANDPSCPSGYYCHRNLCIPSVCASERNPRCPQGYECQSDTCVPAP